MRRKILRLVVAVSTTLVVGGTVGWAAVPDDSHHSFRYQLWKRGRYPFREGFAGAFMADPDRASIVLGRSRTELARAFPPLTEGKKNERYWGEVYGRFRPEDRLVWLWGSNWLVVLRDGKAIYLNYLKG